MRTILLFLCLCCQAALSAQIVGAEYFWGDDPGPGLGFPVDVDQLDEVEVSFDVDVSGLEPGIHRLSYRSQDENGHWSHSERTWVIIDNMSIYAIDAAEYWWDSDPGEGNATPVSISEGFEIEDGFSVSTSGLSPGRHLCGFRVQDELGRWSHHEKINVIIDDPTAHDLIQAEYFWNTDPGVGNGIAVMIDPDEDWTEQVDIDNTGLDIGDHWLHIRVVDEQSHWSHYDRKLITICTSWPAISNWESTLNGFEWTCSDLSEYADSLSWTIDGVEQSTELEFVFSPEGPTEVCLTAYNSCGDSTVCAVVGLPVLLAVNPESLPNTGSYSVDLEGFGLDSLSQVEIRNGIEVISASNVTYVNGTALVADFDFDDETVGFWDVVVILENSEELTLVEGIELTQWIGINDSPELFASIYPNPAKTLLHLNLSEQTQEIMIYDMLGKLIYRNRSLSVNVVLDVESWSSGTYVLIGKSGTDIFHERFQIQR